MIAIVKDRQLVSHGDYYTETRGAPHAAAVRFHTESDRKESLQRSVSRGIDAQSILVRQATIEGNGFMIFLVIGNAPNGTL